MLQWIKDWKLLHRAQLHFFKLECDTKIISDFTPFGLYAYWKRKGVPNSSTICTAEPRTDSDMGPLGLPRLWKLQAQHSHCSLRNVLPFPLLPVQLIFPEAIAMLPFGLALPFKLQYWLMSDLWQRACHGTIKKFCLSFLLQISYFQGRVTSV